MVRYSTVFFFDLKIGRSSSVQARVLRLWEARRMRHGVNMKFIDLLLIDGHASLCYDSIFLS
ncbi:unnamed protein product [Eruca vesicaria subsp. sativa]|uniref:Uncharacterized protein n=1 Tax=Eruca vesicaria subsp. sativa TaxID=29727 RepID=A0ABC8LPG0_ERUVS|nr:unnamed protein product [Eruca vesicaria subsp. sativa]